MRNALIVLVLGISSSGSVISNAANPGLQNPPALAVYFVDVEGGQATLFVSPSGESLLVDAGNPGERDAERIAALAKLAGVTQIDVFVNTHYHGDHAGGVPQLVKRLPIRTFIDHGPNVEDPTAGLGRGTAQVFNAYTPLRDVSQHIIAKPGDTLAVKGLDVRVVSSAGKLIATPMPGAGAMNPACAGFEAKDEVRLTCT